MRSRAADVLDESISGDARRECHFECHCIGKTRKQTQTDWSRRKNPKRKFADIMGVVLKRASLLGFLETGRKTRCLPATRSTAFSSGLPRDSMRDVNSQPSHQISSFFLGRLSDCAGERAHVTFPSDILSRRAQKTLRVRVRNESHVESAANSVKARRPIVTNRAESDADNGQVRKNAPKQRLLLERGLDRQLARRAS